MSDHSTIATPSGLAADKQFRATPTSSASMTGLAEPAYRPWLARFTKTTAGMTFLLIVVGALVTGNKAALSDPTWPAFVGQPLPTARTFVGGLIYEDSHRVLAGLTGLLTLIQAIVLQRVEPRRRVRTLGWAAFGTVVAQALLGGLIIHSMRNPWVSVVHGILAQSFLVLMTAIAFMESRAWLAGHAPTFAAGASGLAKQLRAATIIAFLQLILGAGVRHSQTGFVSHLTFHIAGGVILAGFILFLTIRAFGQFAEHRFLTRALGSLSAAVVIQMLLGAAAVFANRARPEPEVAQLHHVVVSTGHVALGAAILVGLLLTAMVVRRRLHEGKQGREGDKLS
ncbi:MAG: COX15/CtaA family protein [Candidatus Sumerlaea chitinivorans]|nr:COX15/CtaA family protein [Candidatus Sumerlaea chitinivorans]